MKKSSFLFFRLLDSLNLLYNSYLCYLSDEDDNIHRFFLELTATFSLSWTVFLADLGYNSKELLKLPGNQRDIFFFQYLLHWLETVRRLGFNPIKFMYRALLKTQDKDLIDKFKRQIQSGEYAFIKFRNFNCLQLLSSLHTNM